MLCYVRFVRSVSYIRCVRIVSPVRSVRLVHCVRFVRYLNCLRFVMFVSCVQLDRYVSCVSFVHCVRSVSVSELFFVFLLLGTLHVFSTLFFHILSDNGICKRVLKGYNGTWICQNV